MPSIKVNVSTSPRKRERNDAIDLFKIMRFTTDNTFPLKDVKQESPSKRVNAINIQEEASPTSYKRIQ